MTSINYASREVNCKIAYYGPGLCGKTDNLEFIYRKTNPESKGKLISLATETDRTLFFDFLPLELGNVRGFKTRFHLYTVPGQFFYDASRKLILKGVDGVIFVADSQRERMEANLESLGNLEQNLEAQGYDLRSIPYVLQLNKRDSPEAVPVEEMIARLRIGGEPVFEAIAHSEEGIGVFDTLKAVAKLVLEDLTKTDASPGVIASFIEWVRPGRVPPAAPGPAPPARSEDFPPLPRRPETPRRRIIFKDAAPASLEIRFDRSRGFAWDVFALTLFPFFFLVGTSIFLPAGATQHLAVNGAYWLAGLGGALWIHRRNERERLA